MEWFGHQGRWGMSNFRDVDRQTGFLLPPSVDEWLPQRHLARFVVEVIDGLDLRALVGSYRGSGSASYHSGLTWSRPSASCKTRSTSRQTCRAKVSAATFAVRRN